MVDFSGLLSPMNNRRLGALLEELVPDLEGPPGRWQGRLKGVQLIVMTDEGHDRMRVIAPICDVRDVDEPQLWAMMSANFASALDARYCVHDDRVWAAFIHPLSALTADELRSSVAQVTNLVLTFGDTYSGMELRFGG